MAFKRVLPLLLALLLVGCGRQVLIPSSFSGEASQWVVLTPASDEADLSDGLTAVIHNRSDRQFGYSYAFSLETEQNGGWYQLPLRKDFPGFPEPAIFLPGNGQTAFNFDLDRTFGPLEPGRYRILCDGVLLQDNGATEKQHLLLAFTVTEGGTLQP